jgi:CRP-like cAMP-binding protein
MMKEMLTNKILRGLRDAEFTNLMPLLQPVSLSTGERLSEPGETMRFIYFPESSVLSCQADMHDGKSAEVGMIGFEGMAGIMAVVGSLPAVHSLNVSVGGSALRVSTDDFKREILRGDGVQQSLLTYAGEYITQISQRSACAVFHATEQRFAVWLLLLIDRVKDDVIQITQERIAEHLGVRRAGVTVAAGAMQDAGAISYRRGNLRVNDRQMLEAIACECYGTLAVGRQQPHLYI